MSLPIYQNLRKSRRLGQVALTALLIGFGGAALVAMPLGNTALAEKGGNGGGHGGGGDHGGGHGGGNGGGQGHGGGNGGGNGGQGNSDKAGKGASVDGGDDTSDDGTDDSDDSLSAHGLGKLNGFFHASPNGLANASPNSSIGRISHTFKDALSAFAAAGDSTDTTDGTTDGDATPPAGPTVDDLGAILAGATNKPVTAAQVDAIIDRLAEQNPDDAGLNDLADAEDDGTAQDIADAANAAKSGETSTDDGTDDDGTGDTMSDGTDTSTDGTSTVVTTTN
jgi:hypothetical protein